jgi:hypothetical protein
LAPQAGLAQEARLGATAFHCDRRWRVLLRDIFRFGTATVISCLLRAGRLVRLGPGWSVLGGALVLRQAGEPGPARVDRCFVRVVGIVCQSCTALGAQPGTVVPAHRGER